MSNLRTAVTEIWKRYPFSSMVWKRKIQPKNFRKSPAADDRLPTATNSQKQFPTQRKRREKRSGRKLYKYDFLKRENQFCFPLYACARKVAKKYRSYLDEIDLPTRIKLLWWYFERLVKVVKKELGEKLIPQFGNTNPRFETPWKERLREVKAFLFG